LANEEVVNGCCERCGAQVVRKDKEQWMVAITKYADRLIDDLKEVDFIDRVRSTQINWIGRSEGAELEFELVDDGGNSLGEKMVVYTTRPDTTFGVTYTVMAPEHHLVKELKKYYKNAGEVENYVAEATKKSELQRTSDTSKTGVELKGIKAKNPFNGTLIPVFISDYVLTGYGTGAIMAVPAHDQRDYDFAKVFNLPIIQVLAGGDISEKAWEEDGEHINSGFLNGMDKKSAMVAAIKFATENGFGRSKVNFKLRDWVFSRQRYWGEPIPMVYCEHCGWQPLPEEELPLTLPEVPDYRPNDNGDSPLANATEWVKTKCPKCGGAARRETDVMPNWAGSSWYFLRYCDPHNDKEFASKEALEYWMNVDWYNGGMEHTTLHLLYSRFWHKFLYDCGYVPMSEPYHKRTSHGMILASNGEKMSKSRGNVVNPDDIVATYGADTFRLYEMFIGPFDQVAMWSEESLNGVYRFVSRIYTLFKKVYADVKMTADDLRAMHKCILEVTERIDQMKFNTAVSSLMTYVNYMADMEKVPAEMYSVLLKLLSPFTPHLSEEMWARLGHNSLIITADWPQGDAKLAEDTMVTLGVQMNGKMRGTITVSKNATKEETEAEALKLENVARQLEGVSVKKIIVVPGRIVNIVV
jgi:leucyl-tRNA synthetase